MFRHVKVGWILGLLLPLAIGTGVVATASAATKEKTVHHTGIVKAVTPSSITLTERQMLVRHVDNTYPLAEAPKILTSKGAATGTMSEVEVGAKVELTGTQGTDKKVSVTEIRILQEPKASSKKKTGMTGRISTMGSKMA